MGKQCYKDGDREKEGSNEIVDSEEERGSSSLGTWISQRSRFE